MKKDYIVKLKTKKYQIGSFDVYLDRSKQLVKNDFCVDYFTAGETLETMPKEYRAAITNKKGEYVGFIGLFNVDAQNNTASIRIEVKRIKSKDEVEEIITAFKKYMKNSLNLTFVEEEIYISEFNDSIETEEPVLNSNVILPTRLMQLGISCEDLDKFKEEYINIPDLQFPVTVRFAGKTIGIMGLSSLIWSNKRANLNIYLNKELGDEVIRELSDYLIDEYLNFIHSSKVHNVTISIKGSDTNLMKAVNNSSMNFYGVIPFSAVNDNTIESSYMFQHIPNMKKQEGLYLPNNVIAPIEFIKTDKKELDDVINIGNYRMIRPNAFKKEKVDLEKVVDGHVKAMQNRWDYTIPLGEDKYFLQRGDLTKQLLKFTYVLLDDENKYAGFANILRTNGYGKNVEIEMGIDPKLQGRGLGTAVINSFYNELFSIGVASVTSSVFYFNKPSIKLHEKVAQLEGVRIESYYINGRLWDMNIYSKSNDLINEQNSKLVKVMV